MLVLGLDLEATDIDTETARVIEIGAVLYDTEQKKPMKILNELICGDLIENSIPEKITEITKITYEMIQNYAIDCMKVIETLHELVNKAQAIVAHNGNAYDGPLIQNFLKRHGREPIRNDMVWIDTLTDIDYPADCPGANLLTLSAYHGFVNPFPHRAFSDVLSMLKILSFYDVNEIYKVAQTPMCKVIAKVSFHDKDLAKEAGFRWSPEKKLWYKDMREAKIEREKEKWPFPVDIFKPERLLF